MERLERAIEDLEAQNEGEEDAAAVHLPEELADKEVLREQVKQAMADLTSQKRHRPINLTDREARLMKGRQGIVAGYNGQAMVSPMVDDRREHRLLNPIARRRVRQDVGHPYFGRVHPDQAGE